MHNLLNSVFHMLVGGPELFVVCNDLFDGLWRGSSKLMKVSDCTNRWLQHAGLAGERTRKAALTTTQSEIVWMFSVCVNLKLQLGVLVLEDSVILDSPESS